MIAKETQNQKLKTFFLIYNGTQIEGAKENQKEKINAYIKSNLK